LNSRTLEPEYLDVLNPADPRAERSRRELRFVNFVMGNAGRLARALSRNLRDGATVADLGGGDGALMLRVARALRVKDVTVLVVDRAAAISAETRRRFAALGWTARSIDAEALSWMERVTGRFDAITANLFLHHMDDGALKRLLALAAARTDRFAACEPRRSFIGVAGSRALRLAGCSAETCHDAVVSVRAGFADGELSRLWPVRGWITREHRAGPFAHLFTARRSESP